jgi:chitinase
MYSSWIRTACILLLALAQTSLSFTEYEDGDPSPSQKPYKVVCYYTNWAQYRTKPATFFPENVLPKLCTHVIFAFAKINDQSELQAYEWNDESTEWSKGMYERVVALKKINKQLKVLVAVGGWNHGSMAFSNMAGDDAKRRNFVVKTIEFLKKNKFDGLDLDWEVTAEKFEYSYL